MGNEIKYYKEIRKKSGEVKQKPISQKKWQTLKNQKKEYK